MAGISRRYGLWAGALALTLAYALVIQLLLASVFAGRAAGDQLAGDPLSAAVHAICLNGASSTPPCRRWRGRIRRRPLPTLHAAR